MLSGTNNPKIAESARLSRLVSYFADAMREKLWKKLNQGYSGWNDDTDPGLHEMLLEKLFEHVDKVKAGDRKQLVDIANLCAMLWNLDQ